MICKGIENTYFSFLPSLWGRETLQVVKAFVNFWILTLHLTSVLHKLLSSNLALFLISLL